MIDHDKKEVLIASVKEAGKTIKSLGNKDQTESLTKITDFDYGIPADKVSEEIILKGIKESGLECLIISEESDNIGDSDAQYTVYIDPLDGSVNFSRNIPCYCVGIAVYLKDIPILGIVYDSNNDELFVAEKAKGITLNGNTIKTNTFETNHLINLEWFGAEGYEEIVAKLRKAHIRARTAGSGILALLYGTIGRGDGALLLLNKPWDIAPGLVFANEAGIIVKQIDGNDISLLQPTISIIAGPANVFDMLKAALA